MKEEKALSENFLEEFTALLIEASRKAEKEDEIRQIQPVMQKSSALPAQLPKKAFNIMQKPYQKANPTTISRMFAQKIRPSQMITPPFQLLPFGRLTEFLRNPAVTSIECPGSGKNLIVQEGGMIRPLPIHLSQDEISSIMSHVSESTKIPVLKGVFKAALGNLIITALITDSMNIRFHIEKKQIFSPPQGF